MIHRHVDTSDDEFRDLVIADALADYDAAEGPLLVTRLGHVNLQLRSHGLADATANELDGSLP